MTIKLEWVITTIAKGELVSVYIIFAMVTAGFIGILVFDGVVDEGGVEATTRIVDVNGGGSYTKIQEAIDNSNPGDSIRVWAGSYPERIIIDKPLNLIGNSSSNTTINGGFTLDVITVKSDWVNISGFEIINCGSSGFPDFDSGIELNNVNNTHIYNNKIMNCTLGINVANSCQNIIENNYIKPVTGWRENIRLTNSDDNTISNNSLYNNMYGILLSQSENNSMDNNHFEQTGHGIYFSLSNNNNIANNTFLNNTNGIESYSSAFNKIKNNTVVNCYYNGIFIYNSNNEILSNNTMNLCGLNIFTYELSKWDSYEIDTKNSVNGKPIYFLKHADGINIPEGQGQVIIVNCSNIDIENQNYSRTTIGILIFLSNNITINNNNCSLNGLYGINIWNSTSINIQNNTCNFNKRIGIYAWQISNSIIYNNHCLGHTDTTSLGGFGICFMGANSITVSNNNCSLNKIEGINLRGINSSIIRNNFCYSNDKFGIGLYYSGTNIIDDNKCNSNFYDGIYMKDSNIKNIVANNTCNSHLYNGIYIEGSTSNKIMNNTCRNNTRSGLYIALSESNIIRNNTLDKNINSGLKMYSASNNILINNSISSNDEYGVYFIGDSNNFVEKNSFEHNIISNNKQGYYLDFAKSNYIYENIISFNSVTGLWISSSSTDNLIYYNNILSNAQQAADSGTNTWNNLLSEGNFWSDYTGLDDGSGTGKHAIIGDGIGDTNIPHLGLDNYPFVQNSGWIQPGKLVLHEPGGISFDGNYSISWTPAVRTTGYTLEEDDNIDFSSPVVAYDGTDTSVEYILRSNGTYFYRAKAYNDQFESGWSNIVNISVDWPPAAPANFMAIEVTSDKIIFSCDASPEPDIAGINLYINSTGGGASGPFEIAQTLPAYTTEFACGHIAEETTYYFVLKAFDKNNSYSPYSNVVTASTPDDTPPPAPTGLTAVGIANDRIDLSWDVNTAVDLAGYHIYMNETGEGAAGNYKLIETLTGALTGYGVTGLSEQVEYFFRIIAFDEIPNNSSGSNIASATTPDLIPPSAPTGLAVTNETYNSLEIRWNKNPDHDVVAYLLYRSEKISGPFEPVNIAPITTTEFIDTDLNADFEYFYKLKAKDDADLVSNFSDAVSGITLLGPTPPYLKKPFSDISIPEDSYVNDLILLYDHFTDDNNDALYFACTGQVNLDVRIYQNNGTVVLRPKLNWNGRETLTFSASDDNVSYVQDSLDVTVTALNDRPYNASIYSALPGYYINGRPQFSGSCEDHDIIYGDELSFVWYLEDNRKLGEGKELGLEPYTLDAGTHTIRLIVTDSGGLSVEAELEFEISKLPAGQPGKNDTADENDSKALLLGGITAVVVFMIILILFLLMRRRKKGDYAQPDTEVQPQAAETQAPVPSMEPEEGYPPPGQPMYRQDAGIPVVEEPPQDFQAQPVSHEVMMDNGVEVPLEQPNQEQDLYRENEQPSGQQPPEQPPEQAPEQATADQDNIQSVTCPVCGAQIAAYTTPCPGCNTTLNW